MISIDMWYKNNPKEITGIDWSFSGLDCVYHGNVYKDGKTIGEFTADTMQEVQEAFPHLAEAIDKALNQKGLDTMRKALDFIILVLMVAAISSAATRVYMIRTAAPSIPCSIAWGGEAHSYQQAPAGTNPAFMMPGREIAQTKNRDIAELIFNSLSDGYDNEEERPETVAELAAELEQLKEGATLKDALIALCERVEELQSQELSRKILIYCIEWRVSRIQITGKRKGEKAQ